MTYDMKLKPTPFMCVKSGTKDIEMRLNDEKRRLVRVGDKIRFTNTQTGETLTVLVVNRHEYPTFAELYAQFDKTRLGYFPWEEANPEDMSQYYPDGQIKHFGVVGLEIQLL